MFENKEVLIRFKLSSLLYIALLIFLVFIIFQQYQLQRQIESLQQYHQSEPLQPPKQQQDWQQPQLHQAEQKIGPSVPVEPALEQPKPTILPAQTSPTSSETAGQTEKIPPADPATVVEGKPATLMSTLSGQSFEHKQTAEVVSRPDPEAGSTQPLPGYIRLPLEISPLDEPSSTRQLSDSEFRSIRKQLKRCKRFLQNYDLTTGKNGNAFECYQQVLLLDPQNPLALRGMVEIEETYELLIEKYFRQNNLRKVSRYIDRLAQVNENNPNLGLYRQRLQSRTGKPADTSHEILAGAETQSAPAGMSPAATGSQEVARPLADAENTLVDIVAGCVNRPEDQGPLCVEKDYRIQKFEVTQKQWQEIMGYNPSRFRQCGADCPVENVSWFEVQQFIRKLNQKTGLHYRLPTEAEWEYAARAGSAAKFASGEDMASLYLYANYCDRRCQAQWSDPEHDDGAQYTSRVGQYQPNAWGLYDMSGNVWEWTHDKFIDQKQGNSGINDSDKHTYKGCSWGDSSMICLLSARAGAKPDFKVSGIGFRLVADKR